jgi:glycosyltransferase involved in cell wall biosynthesis
MSKQKLRLPSRYRGILVQPQLGPLIPGSGIIKWIIRLHDIFPITNPEWFRRIDVIQFTASLNLALEYQAEFICDSFASQNYLLGYAKRYKVNSRVVYCKAPSLSDELCKNCMACKSIEQNLLPKSFFLTVGTIEPRKNYNFALDFWGRKFRNREILIIVGRAGWKTKLLRFKLRCNKSSVLWFKQVCDGALRILYSNSRCYISFSLNEGFDLPAMEARSFNIPLLLTDIEIHRELHEGNAMFFKSENELEFRINSLLHKDT